MNARLAIAATALVALAGCVAPHPGDEARERPEMITGSNLPKKYRPGDDNVQVYKPTPADMARIGPGPDNRMEPTPR